MGRKALLQSNKGFTLVELCVVMVLFSILVTITTMGLMKWQEYSTYTQQEESAELVYMAARNKIAKLRANNVLDDYERFGDESRKLTGITYPDVPENDLRWAFCSMNEYDNYDNLMKGNDPTGAKLIFDLISDYIYDDVILNGSIGIEYSASTGVVYKVFFSDRTNICYGPYASGEKMNLVANRAYDHLEKKVIGVYTLIDES